VSVVVNLGGEGEEPGALNVNAFLYLLRPSFADKLSPELVIRASAHKTGLDPESVDLVVANHFPIQYDEIVIDETGARAAISDLAAEIVRVLKPGGRVHFGCSTCDRASLAEAMELAGLIDVHEVTGGYIDARKP
jgi:hypothetical protein